MPDPSKSAHSRSVALAQVAAKGGEAMSAPARAAFLKTFEDAVDPDGTLDPVERAKRVSAARKSYFAKLAAASVKSRRKAHDQKAAKETADWVRRCADDIEFAGERDHADSV
jgi:hypothetical protein